MIRAPNLDAAGIPHGFSTRADTDEDAWSAIAPSARRFVVQQVHGRAVAVVQGGADPAEVSKERADSILLLDAGTAAGVVTADCVPVLLSDRAGRAIAIHAGWRGTVQGVVDAAIETYGAHGGRAQDLLAAIGPHIRACCFEVGEDVAAELERVGARIDRGPPRPHADLASAIRSTLERLGLSDVVDVGGCTRCEPQTFHSYRRSGAKAGRQISVVAARQTGFEG